MINRELIIKKNKFNKVILMLPSLTFTIIGVWLVFLSPKLNTTLTNSETLIKIIGLLSVIFFGFCVFIILKKIIDNKYGLKISKKGIYDNSSSINIGLIKWENIERIESRKVMNRKYIKVVVNNPEDFIKKQKNDRIKKMIESNFKIFGSPIHIYTNNLNMRFKDLFELINVELVKRK